MAARSFMPGRRRMGLVAQPAQRLGGLGRSVKQPDIDYVLRRHPALGDLAQPRSWVKYGQPRGERIEVLARRDIGLGDQEPVGDRRLLDRLGMRIELLQTVYPVDGGDDTVDYVMPGYEFIGHQRVQDRRRIGEAGGLDDDAPEGWQFAAHPPEPEVRQRFAQAVGNGAAQAPGVE